MALKIFRPTNSLNSFGGKAFMTFEIKVLRSASEIRAIKEQWLALEQKSAGTTLFQSYEWCAHILELDRASGDDSYFVVAAYSGDQLAALLPLTIWDKKGRKVLTGLGEPYQQYTEMFVDPAFEPDRVFAAMQPELEKSGADYLHFGQVRHDGNLFAGSQTYFHHAEEEKAAPFVDLTQWGQLRRLSRRTEKDDAQALTQCL